MFIKKALSSIVLATTLFIASIGICTAMTIPSVDIMDTGIHSAIMDCLENSAACPIDMAEHMSFLSSLIPGLNQDVLGKLLALVMVIVPLALWFVAKQAIKSSSLEAAYRFRLRQYLFAPLEWFTLPQLTLAFSRGILNSKRYNA